MTGPVRHTRHLDLEGTVNLRDLGGYETAEGRRTRWRTFLRCGTMHRITDASKAALVDMGLRTVIDLRTTVEIQDQPNVFAGSDHVAYRRQNMVGDEPQSDSSVTDVMGEVSEMILSSYGRTLDSRQEQVRLTLAALAEPGALPAVYHCAGGKDRTGMISALLLGIAGVPDKTIAQDYALSATYLLDRYMTEQAPPGMVAGSYTAQDYQDEFCPPEGMLAVLTHLRDRYGGVEGYVRAAGLGDLEIDRLRSALVE